MQNQDLKFAVLIDAENVPYASVGEMFEEIAKYGTPTFKRIYADWTHQRMSGWKGVLLENGITPIQQYSYTQGKNATDSALIIDAMDILYRGKVDGFCIVSSDSDFTRLATRLREAGMMVIGIGEKKTANPFIAACDKFIYIEILKKPEDIPVSNSAKKTKTPSKSKPLNELDPKLIKLIKASIGDIADENGWAFLGELGNLLLKKKPDFDARNYGFNKLYALLKSINKFEMREVEASSGNARHIYVRVKD